MKSIYGQNKKKMRFSNKKSNSCRFFKKRKPTYKDLQISEIVKSIIDQILEIILLENGVWAKTLETTLDFKVSK